MEKDQAQQQKLLKTLRVTLMLPVIMCFAIGCVMMFGDDPSQGWVLFGLSAVLAVVNTLVVRVMFTRMTEQGPDQAP